MSEEFPETTTDLMARARAPDIGVEVTLNQLARWRRKGLLPAAHRKGLGRGRGVESHYPAGTSEQLASLLKAQKEDSRFSYVGWKMWSEGWPVEEFIRAEFLEHIEEVLERVVDDLNRFEATANQTSGPNFNNAIHNATGGKFDSSITRLFLEVLAGRPVFGVAGSVPIYSEGDDTSKDRWKVFNLFMAGILSDLGVKVDRPLPLEDSQALWSDMQRSMDLSEVKEYIESISDELLRDLRDRSWEVCKRWGTDDPRVARRLFRMGLMFRRINVDMYPVMAAVEVHPAFKPLYASLRNLAEHGRPRRRGDPRVKLSQLLALMDGGGE